MALFLAPVVPHAHTVFDGYEAYYNSLPNRVFQDQGIELQPYSLEGDEVVRYGWSGMAAGRPQKVEVREGQLKIDGRVLPTKRVKAFRDEVAHEADLGHGTTAYFSPGWICVENTPSSSSGTAVRHKAVYLIRQTDKKQEAWKLPSLFASCTGIRWQGKLPQFDKAEYRYLDGQDEPLGVVFKEYVIRGNKFVATGGTRSTTFVEPGNVYKFSVRRGHQP